MPALPPKADIEATPTDVCFVQEADIHENSLRNKASVSRAVSLSLPKEEAAGDGGFFRSSHMEYLT